MIECRAMNTAPQPFLMRVRGGPDVPALALESTVISHGLPYPQNLETALRLEDIAREAGAQPATVGILGGQVIVGLDRGRDRAPGDRAGGAQGQPPRPAGRARAPAGRRDDGRHDGLGRAPRGHPRLCDRRHRRRPPHGKSQTGSRQLVSCSMCRQTCRSWHRRPSSSCARARRPFSTCPRRWNGWRPTA
jgi:hypothetical protein